MIGVAKITMTFEDMPDGSVDIVSDPDIDEMCRMELEDSPKITSAHGYAIAAWLGVEKAQVDELHETESERTH